MTGLLLLSRADVARLMDFPAYVDAVEAGFRAAVTQGIGRRAFVGVHAEGMINVIRWTARLDGVPVWTAPRLAATFGVDADGLAAEPGEEVRDRARGGTQIEHPVARLRVDERPDGLEPQLGPRRPLEIRGRHRVHEPLVVLGRGPAERR